MEPLVSGGVPTGSRSHLILMVPDGCVRSLPSHSVPMHILVPGAKISCINRLRDYKVQFLVVKIHKNIGLLGSVWIHHLKCKWLTLWIKHVLAKLWLQLNIFSWFIVAKPVKVLEDIYTLPHSSMESPPTKGHAARQSAHLDYSHSSYFISIL